MSDAPPIDCAACHAPVAGRYCAACGERRPEPEDERLGPFLREQFHEVTSADGKLWRTIKGLFVPGKLTEEYFSGRRGLFARPVRIFLVVNVVLFFLMSGNSGTIIKGPLRTHFGAAVYGSVAERMALARAAVWDLDLDGIAAAFDAHATALAPSLLGVMIPAFALLFAVGMWPVRASGVRHLVLATHTVAAFMCGSLLLMLAFSLGMNLIDSLLGVRFESVDPVMVPVLIVVQCVYLGFSVRRVYGVGTAYATVAGALLGTLGFAFAFWLYRLVLFFVTFWTLGEPVG